MRARMNSWLVAAVLLPLAMFAVSGPGYAAWRCLVMGTVQASCCCPTMSDAGQTPAPAESAWRRSACCEVAAVAFDKATVDVTRATAVDEAPPVLAWPVGVIVFASPPHVIRRPEGPRAGPPDGRALIVAKQALLI